MKKSLCIFLAAFFFTCIAACNGEYVQNSNEHTGEETAREGTATESLSIQNQDEGRIEDIENQVNSVQSGNNGDSRPSRDRHEAKSFYSVDSLIEWIQATDLETFQDGRFNDKVALLRDKGELLVPSFIDDVPQFSHGWFEPDNSPSNGCLAIEYCFRFNDENGNWDGTIFMGRVAPGMALLQVLAA